jgi:ligand-binding SRPBCC domain-containing protein
MKTLLSILNKAGGWRPSLQIRLENPPHITLVIESLDESGPLGLPAISVAHYSEVSGDLMRHPEMQFELDTAVEAPLKLLPFYWRNDFVPEEQVSRYIDEFQYKIDAATYARHVRFAELWDEVLGRQRFEEAFTDKCIVG